MKVRALSSTLQLAAAYLSTIQHTHKDMVRVARSNLQGPSKAGTQVKVISGQHRQVIHESHTKSQLVACEPYSTPKHARPAVKNTPSAAGWQHTHT